jgi:hypothetical protein
MYVIRYERIFNIPQEKEDNKWLKYEGKREEQGE